MPRKQVAALCLVLCAANAAAGQTVFGGIESGLAQIGAGPGSSGFDIRLDGVDWSSRRPSDIDGKSQGGHLGLSFDTTGEDFLGYQSRLILSGDKVSGSSGFKSFDVIGVRDSIVTFNSDAQGTFYLARMISPSFVRLTADILRGAPVEEDRSEYDGQAFALAVRARGAVQVAVQAFPFGEIGIVAGSADDDTGNTTVASFGSLFSPDGVVAELTQEKFERFAQIAGKLSLETDCGIGDGVVFSPSFSVLHGSGSVQSLDYVALLISGGLPIPLEQTDVAGVKWRDYGLGAGANVAFPLFEGLSGFVGAEAGVLHRRAKGWAQSNYNLSFNSVVAPAWDKDSVFSVTAEIHAGLALDVPVFDVPVKIGLTVSHGVDSHVPVMRIQSLSTHALPDELLRPASIGYDSRETTSVSAGLSIAL